MTTINAIIIEETEAYSGYHNATIRQIAKPVPTDNQVLISVKSVSLNHRDLSVRRNKFPGIVWDTVLGSDAYGTISSIGKSVTKSFKPSDRVVVLPGQGWDKDPRGPEEEYFIRGGSEAAGVMADFIAFDQQDVFKIPDHLSDIEAAALPLAGVTAYRALFTKAMIKKGDNVLIPGIGGGVALFALSFAVAAGANVFVSSSNDAKIEKAISLGAKGGFNYKDQDWGKQLKDLLKGESLNAVIDGAGGKGIEVYTDLLRMGGIIVNYGMTASPEVVFTMAGVLKNLELKGTAMGSRQEFGEMIKFVEKYQIRPVVSQVFEGLNQADEAFEVMRNSSQFGKLVLTL